MPTIALARLRWLAGCAENEGRKCLYRKCPDCGASLGPGEVCDCRKEAAPDESDPEAAQTKEFYKSIPNNQIIVNKEK